MLPLFIERSIISSFATLHLWRTNYLSVCGSASQMFVFFFWLVSTFASLPSFERVHSVFLKRAEWTWNFWKFLGFLSLKALWVISFLCVMSVLHKLALITKLYGYHFYASLAYSISALPLTSYVTLGKLPELSASVASFVKWDNNSHDLRAPVRIKWNDTCKAHTTVNRLIPK